MTLISARGCVRILPTAFLFINLPGGSVAKNRFSEPVTNYSTPSEHSRFKSVTLLDIAEIKCYRFYFPPILLNSNEQGSGPAVDDAAFITGRI